MSKIGRKPINIGNTQVEIKGNEVHYKGAKAAGLYVVDSGLSVQLKGKDIYVTPKEQTADTNRVWGLNRALLANKLKGADVGFEKQLRINGLGFKAVVAGPKIQFSLGYSHKIDFDLPKNVTVEVDKTGQLMTFKSFDKDLLGQVCSNVRDLRKPEPYKGTGIQYATEVIRRKAGKAKS
jgi:large subunit ribosomal protein L6